MIGTRLENAGWRQGSIVKTTDIKTVLDNTEIKLEANLVLVVASQSCDVANNNTGLDPYIEFSICRRIDTKEKVGNYLHNKNPRILHTSIMCKTGGEDVFDEHILELKAFEKILINKNIMDGIQPDNERIFEKRQLEDYVAWLSSRYSRPALPTTFNARISKADPKGKLREQAKKANNQLAGIYVEIIPDDEIGDTETYDVNLLGLLPADFSEDPTKAKVAIEKYTEVMQAAGMNVRASTLKETEVSIATIKRFKRFYLDDLSFQAEAPLPPEISM